jgi:flagellar basal-body rod protein FlgF
MTEITNLVRINRAYTTLAAIVDQNSQLNRSAVERLGRVA